MRVWLYTSPKPNAVARRLVRLAKAAEHSGFDGLIVAAPSPATLHIGRSACDSGWATMSAVARGTRRLRLGVLLQPAHLTAPHRVAASAAALDRCSGGRLEFGLAAVRAAGGPGRGLPPMAEGFTRLDETLAVITGLWWTSPGERFTFTGRYHTVLNHPAVVPAQRPGPPLIVSGPGRHTTSYLAARWADEVNVPFRGLHHTVRQYWNADDASSRSDRRPRDRQRLGRSAALTVRFDPVNCRHRHEPAAPVPHACAGDALLKVLATLGQYHAIGTDRVYLRLPDNIGQRHLDLVARQILPIFHGARTPGPSQPHAC
ncbi:LLM class flavin-dependent oxidoreductase [Phytohabitans kaempferiae]|uniref:LLM class flavin-dependent oxidoreductase n=1 Tax=Phytohabitans kaempferiae TaxID=1620943 RepID=A0ABV6MEV4_9ACTN